MLKKSLTKLFIELNNMETQILKEIERLQKSARDHNPKSDYRDGYLKALLNIKQEIKEMIDIRDKTGYYKK